MTDKAEEIQALLFLLDKDWELRNLLSLLEKDPQLLLFLFEKLSNEKNYSDAKAQIASVIGKAPVDEKKRQDLLLHFVQDENEYVVRMALIALGKLGYAEIEKLVQRLWSQLNEDMKMACLHALKEKNRPISKSMCKKL